MTESSVRSVAGGNADDLVDVRVVLNLAEQKVRDVGAADRCERAPTGRCPFSTS
jgi:hypothetical protein